MRLIDYYSKVKPDRKLFTAVNLSPFIYIRRQRNAWNDASRTIKLTAEDIGLDIILS